MIVRCVTHFDIPNFIEPRDEPQTTQRKKHKAHRDFSVYSVLKLCGLCGKKNFLHVTLIWESVVFKKEMNRKERKAVRKEIQSLCDTNVHFVVFAVKKCCLAVEHWDNHSLRLLVVF